MRMIADAMVVTPTISALYKPYLGGNIYVSNLPDRVVITFYAYDYELVVYGRRPRETFDYQIVLHSDGRVAFQTTDQTRQIRTRRFRDGIVGLFPTDLTTGVVPRTPDRVTDLSRPDSQFLRCADRVVSAHPAIRDREEGRRPTFSCRIIEVLGGRVRLLRLQTASHAWDIQESGPRRMAFGGYYQGKHTG